MQFLPGLKAKSLEELNESFDLWLNDMYHQRKHSATAKSPFERFIAHMECLRAAPADLKDYFRKNARRRVAKDRTITLNGKLYEAPVTLIGKQVLLLFHENQPAKLMKNVWKQMNVNILFGGEANLSWRKTSKGTRGTLAYSGYTQRHPYESGDCTPENSSSLGIFEDQLSSLGYRQAVLMCNWSWVSISQGRALFCVFGCEIEIEFWRVASWPRAPSVFCRMQGILGFSRFAFYGPLVLSAFSGYDARLCRPVS
jgi:hypothetical protein